jgi:hypothetical protein
MEALEIEGQADQEPFARSGGLAAQRELAEAALCWPLGPSVRVVSAAYAAR